MRLTRLALKNYRSHPDTDLDLRAVSAAIICGPTGGGKSSLPDAFLWGPYGRTFGRDVVRLGADTCQVIEEFTTGGSEYRITRTLSRKTARGKTELQLVTRQNGGKWEPLSGKSVDETEAKIREVIGLSYEAMIAGPVSPQDQYRRFLQPPSISIDGKTYSGPQARLQILAQMMGLEYEPLRRAALKIIAGLEPQVATLKDQIAAAEGRLAGMGAAQEAFRQAGLELFGVRDRLSTAQAEDEAARRGVSELQQEVARLAERLAGLDGLRKEEKTLADRSKALSERQARHQAVLSHKDEVQAKAEEDRALAGRLDELRRNQTAVEGLVAARHATEMTALKAKHQRERRTEDERAEIEKGISSGKESAASSAKAFAEKIEDYEHRASLLTQVPCRGLQALTETCPLLANARVAESACPALHEEYERAMAWTPDPASLARLAELEALLAQGATDAELKNATAARTEAERNLAVIREDIEQVEEQRKLLARWVAVVPQIELAEREVPGVATEIAKTVVEQEAVAGRLVALQDDEAALAKTRETLLQAEGQVATWTERVAVFRKQEVEGSGKVAGAQAGVKVLEEVATFRRSAEANLVETRTRLRTFETLAEAYKAIPLMVTESVVIPEVEPEANRMLAKISPNGMRLALPTQRALKSREGVADGLEIVVRDRVGERDTSDFSGGQAFLVALALRVAMTRFQAKRAGKPIETLVIDEGFGALDAGTLAEVIPALRTVAEEFPCLLVVSHVAEMRDCFGTRIEVSGGPEHSVAKVVQG